MRKNRPGVIEKFSSIRPPEGLRESILIREDALGDTKLPTGTYSQNGWDLMFQRKNGLILMWASQAPMEEFKQLLVET